MAGRIGGAGPALALVLLGGCERGPAGAAETAAPPAAERAAPSLIGTWRTAQPARFAGEGLRTETREGRTRYKADGSFAYSGRLIIFGERLPPDGLAFRMRGEGAWAEANRILTERFTTLDIAPEAANPALEKLGRDMAAELIARPPSEADIQALDENQLMLRDRATGATASFTRAEDAPAE